MPEQILKETLKEIYEQLQKLQLRFFILRTNYKKIKEENKKMKYLLDSATKDISYLLENSSDFLGRLSFHCDLCRFSKTCDQTCDSCEDPEWRDSDKVLEIFLKSE